MKTKDTIGSNNSYVCFYNLVMKTGSSSSIHKSVFFVRVAPYSLLQSKMTTRANKLTEKYARSTNEPTFNNFTSNNVNKIEKISVSLCPISAINLQRYWIAAYNKKVNVLRPGKPLVEKIKSANKRYISIHKIATEKRKTKESLRLAVLAQTRSQARTVRRMVTYQEEDEEDEEELSFEMIKNLKKFSLGGSVVEKEFQKLVESSCINLLHQNYIDLYKKVIPSLALKKINEKCVKIQKEFEENCNTELRALINKVFDDLKKFKNDESTLNILIDVDEKKSKITDKESDEYVILSIIGTIVKSFKTYTDEAKVSEATYLRKFEQILDDLLFPISSIVFYDGESVSRSTKRMKIIKEEDVDYGRRIDLIIKSKGEEQYELSANEFKRSNVSRI